MTGSHRRSPSGKAKRHARLPGWSEAALQGVAYWIGHRRAYYRHHVLTEGAIVAELCNLMNAHLGEHEQLECERLYRDLLSSASPKAQAPWGEDRLDIAIVADRKLLAAVEVKRASATRQLIDRDLKRLSALKRAFPRMRAFLVVVSEATRPSRFVDGHGRALRGQPNVPAPYAVRRVCVASPSASRGNSAHYAVLIEVLR